MLPDSVEEGLRVNIRPGARILSTLRHLNYRPWFALAEFVDNALQSFLTNEANITTVTSKKQSQVTVSIEIDSTSPARIAIRDDAAGIALKDFARAFRPGGNPGRRDWSFRIRHGDEKRSMLVCSALARAH